MERTTKILSIVLIVLFITGTVITAYFLYELPRDLMTNSELLDFYGLLEISHILTRINVIVGLVLFIGLLSIVVTLKAEKANRKGNIVYIEVDKSKKEDKEGKDKEQMAYKAEDDLDVIDTQPLEELIKKHQSDPKKASERFLAEVCKKVDACQGALYVAEKEEDKRIIRLYSAFAFSIPESQSLTYEFGEGLSGQAAKDGQLINLSEVPKGYLKILSGLGSASPSHLLILPLFHEEEVIAVVEIASFQSLNKRVQDQISKLFELIIPVLPQSQKASKTESKAGKKKENNGTGA